MDATPPGQPRRLDGWDRLAALLIFVGVFALLMLTMQMGVTRDESFYFHAAADYAGWFRDLGAHLDQGRVAHSFTQANVDAHWGYNPEHPALMKTLFALSHLLFHERLDWLTPIQAWRLPGAAVSAWLVAMVYLFGRQLFGRAAGALGAAALLLQPRFFFHAHMACFDAAMGAMWFAVVWAYWRSWSSRGWAAACGGLWGVALATKLNAFFLPVVLVVHWLLTSWRGFGVERSGGKGLWVRLPPMPWAFVAMAALGPLIFYLHWPRIWFDTFERVWWYMKFHLTHTHYFVYYFGDNLYYPPFPQSFPWVMTLVTVPAVILVAAALGGVGWWRERAVGQWWVSLARAVRERALPEAGGDPRGTGLLLLINLVFPLALIARPETPVFGGTKHWIPAMPFLAMFAGFGAVWAASRAAQALGERRGQRRALIVVASLLLVVPASLEVAGSHPDGLSYYNTLIGSHRGAADARMMRQYWGYTARDVAPWLNANAPKGARVWTHNATRWAWQAYQDQGIVRADLRPSGMRGADYAIYFHQKSFHHQLFELWGAFGTRTPVHVHAIDGVPLISIYEHPRAAQRRAREAAEATAP